VENDALGPIAILDSRLLPGGNYESFLSQDEHEEFLRFRAPLRKSEWLAGRLSSKFLFLSGQSGMLSTADLSRFPPSLYRDTEVVRNDRVRFGLPQVGRGAEFRDVAISHTNGIACALLGTGEVIASREAIAVDIERVVSRSPAFCRGNFTEGEQARAAEYSQRLGLDPQWTFTLLWSIKECLLKTPSYNGLSIWDMPSLDIYIVSGEDDLMGPQSAGEFFGDFVLINVEATNRSRTVSHSVAVSGRYDLVLTAVRGEDRGMV
jgi:phosphopantetheinyl transferase